MDQTKELLAKFEEALKNADSSEALEQLRVEYCGKKGHVAALMGQLKTVPNEEKKAFGQAVNVLNQEIEKMIRMAPEQYLWLHRRFKTAPDENENRYPGLS